MRGAVPAATGLSSKITSQLARSSARGWEKVVEEGGFVVIGGVHRVIGHGYHIPVGARHVERHASIPESGNSGTVFASIAMPPFGFGPKGERNARQVATFLTNVQIGRAAVKPEYCAGKTSHHEDGTADGPTAAATSRRGRG